jgi:hypothetical protein
MENRRLENRQHDLGHKNAQSMQGLKYPALLHDGMSSFEQRAGRFFAKDELLSAARALQMIDWVALAAVKGTHDYAAGVTQQPAMELPN